MALLKTDLNKAQIFATVQGEGVYSGVPSFFIRMQGCSVKCFFCDEKTTWKKGSYPDIDTFKISLASKEASSDAAKIFAAPEEILEYLSALNPSLKRVVLTGGEPSEQDLKPLIRLLLDNGYKVAIETAASGQYISELLELPIWITFSPKEIYSQNGKPFDPLIWAKCSELKFVLANENALQYIEEQILVKLAKYNNPCPVFITPDWFNFEENKALALELCAKYPERLRIGLQAHKYLSVD